jgi:hypothetical protein
MSSTTSISIAIDVTLVRQHETRFNGAMEIGLPDTEREIVVMPLEEPVPAVPEELPLSAPDQEPVPA